mgnify:CR=1 FL=1
MEFNTLSLILCIALVVVGAVCFFIGMTYRKKVAEKEIGSAEEEARRIINESIKGGESKKRASEAGAAAPAEGRIARQEA